MDECGASIFLKMKLSESWKNNMRFFENGVSFVLGLILHFLKGLCFGSVSGVSLCLKIIHFFLVEVPFFTLNRQMIRCIIIVIHVCGTIFVLWSAVAGRYKLSNPSRS